ncbi:alpha/beta-hydrolase [Tothia fuscella]|uniref:Alpha/beta-hydrolase n=1 Tax=Tothia fuscella TaxID=1048955 RepID=A0A9P4TTT6_9PEZI|nr:alpha/beta-hydrolase [Tothia fuscella]
MSSKPTVIVVPGAWHTSEGWKSVSDHFTTAGYPFIGIEKPSVSLGPTYIQNFDPDVEAVRSEIAKAANDGKDIVVLMHSYGGVPGSAACKGFSKEDRAKEGKKGGVIRLVYVAAFALDEGVSLASLGNSKSSRSSQWSIIDDSGEFATVADGNYRFYHDVDPAIADENSAKLQHHAFKTFRSEQTYAAWKHIPSTYVVCEEDRAVPAEVQEHMASQEGGLWTVKSLKSSHSPFLSMPKDLAEIIRKAAGEDI